MSEWFTAILMLLGAGFVLLASIGILRMPDLFTRLQASAKASTLGCGLILMAVAIWFGTLEAVTIALVVAVFIVLTAPVAAHMIARAAYLVGVPLWSRTVVDEFRDRAVAPKSSSESRSGPEKGRVSGGVQNPLSGDSKPAT